MKKEIIILLASLLFMLTSLTSFANSGTNSTAEQSIETSGEIKLNAKSALLMEANTGKILFCQNENEKSSPASVTKIMTLLLVAEALEDGRVNKDDKIIISDYAASMGGSQVFLEEGEEMSVEELLKCTVIASANDAAVALAEHIGGSEQLFVGMMNKRATELGLENTFFENVTGLDNETKNHLTTAKDIAIMSRELLKYDIIKKYSSLWQDTIRNGEFTLTNTNRLVRYYDGCNGLKTGSTDKAGYCVSASAERGGMQLIAVIMGAESRDERNTAARTLLDYGFSNYTLYQADGEALEEIPVCKGTKISAVAYSTDFSCVISKADVKKMEKIFDIPETITAPLEEKAVIGKITYKIGDTTLGTSDIYVQEEINEISFFDVLTRIFKYIFTGKF